MKKFLLLVFCVVSLHKLSAQNILVVNDNDYITYNTDTLLIGLNNSIYSGYDYWSIPDSAGVGPTSAFMDNYDLVIWYCSTDGLGLEFWDVSTAGNAEITAYIVTGKPIWIIGQDILYQYYGGSSTFAAGEFAYDFMGLQSYDYQSYADDGNTGAPQVDRIATAPSVFPDSLLWIFATNWYVDGCTPLAGTIEIYEMGPSTYTLAGQTCMFHNNQLGYSVMSSFIDPALIDTRANRIDFLESTITYLLNASEIDEHKKNLDLSIYPNPASNQITIHTKERGHIRLINASGQVVHTASKADAQFVLDVSAFENGIYFIQLISADGNVINEKFIVDK